MYLLEVCRLHASSNTQVKSVMACRYYLMHGRVYDALVKFFEKIYYLYNFGYAHAKKKIRIAITESLWVKSDQHWTDFHQSVPIPGAIYD